MKRSIAIVLAVVAIVQFGLVGVAFAGSKIEFGSGGLTIGLANTLYCQLVGCTMTGSLTFSGVTNDILGTASEDLRITPALAGTGSVQIGDGDGIIDLLDTSSATNGQINMTSASGPRVTRGSAANDSFMEFFAATNGGARINNISNVAATDDILRVGDNADSALWRFLGDGTLRAVQTTTGTPPTWRVPTAIANDTITLPTCATSADAGKLLYVDDSNDTARAMLCVCLAGADDSTYAWEDTADGTTNCIDP